MYLRGAAMAAMAATAKLDHLSIKNNSSITTEEKSGDLYTGPRYDSILNPNESEENGPLFVHNVDIRHLVVKETALDVNNDRAVNKGIASGDLTLEELKSRQENRWRVKGPEKELRLFNYGLKRENADEWMAEFRKSYANKETALILASAHNNYPGYEVRVPNNLKRAIVRIAHRSHDDVEGTDVYENQHLETALGYARHEKGVYSSEIVSALYELAKQSAENPGDTQYSEALPRLMMSAKTVFTERSDSWPFLRAAFFKALTRADVAAAKEMQQYLAAESFGFKDGSGNTPVMVACLTGHADVAKYAIQLKSDVSYDRKEANKYGINPAHVAAALDKAHLIEVVNHLPIDPQSETALGVSVQEIKDYQAGFSFENDKKYDIEATILAVESRSNIHKALTTAVTEEKDELFDSFHRMGSKFHLALYNLVNENHVEDAKRLVAYMKTSENFNELELDRELELLRAHSERDQNSAAYEMVLSIWNNSI